MDHKVSPIIDLNHCSLFEDFDFPIWIKYDALNSSLCEGNKFWKLYGLYRYIKTQHYRGVLTFGGAFSNHLFAISHWAEHYKVPVKVLVRGYEPKTFLHTLRTVRQCGVQIEFIPPNEYREQCRVMSERTEKDGFFILPEGGAHPIILDGLRLFYETLERQFEEIKSPFPKHIALAAGTGSSAAALQTLADSDKHLHVFNVVRHDHLDEEMDAFIKHCGLRPICQRSIYSAYDFGAYGKFNSQLLEFIELFYTSTGLVLDPVYTGKMVYGLLQELNLRPWQFQEGLLLWHTGGTQGILSFNELHKTKLPELTI